MPRSRNHASRAQALHDVVTIFLTASVECRPFNAHRMTSAAQSHGDRMAGATSTRVTRARFLSVLDRVSDDELRQLNDKPAKLRILFNERVHVDVSDVPPQRRLVIVLVFKWQRGRWLSHELISLFLPAISFRFRFPNEPDATGG
jgi:hypothetical protein